MKAVLHFNQKSIIESLYAQGLSANLIGKQLGVSTTAVIGFFHRYKIPFRSLTQRHQRYNLNEYFFDVIDTEVKAYFLGLMYADGYNHETRHRICLALQVNDKIIIEKFATALQSSHPIKIDKASMRQFKSGKCNIQPIAHLGITNKRLSASLAKQGCFQKKSLTLRFPTSNQVPEHLLRHFIRGYFDGDGSFYFSTRRRPGGDTCVSFISSRHFCEKLADILRTNFGFKCTVHDDCRHPISNIYIGGNKQTPKLMNWMYLDATVWLPRKRERYEAFQTFYQQRHFPNVSI